VAIKIGGQSFTGWDEVTIEMAIDNCADGFSLSAAYDPDRRDLAAAFRNGIFNTCTITIDGEAVLTGRVMKLDAESGPDDRTIKVEGMSSTGPLVDCSIDGELEFSGLTLAGICRKVCAPFGIAIRADSDTEIIDFAKAEYGQGAFDFLNSLASPRNFFLNSSYTGQLIISSAAKLLSLPVAASLIEGQKPILSVSTSNNGQLRFSSYKVASQFAGLEDVVDEATDPSVPLYRPHLIVEDEAAIAPDVMTAAQAKAFAKKTRTAARTRTMAFASSFQARATVIGWKAPNGLRWHERQIVTLLAPGAMLSTETRYVIAGITFKLHPDSGETVDMRLVLPELYAGALPQVMPWD
jgi:prophage tail gpP-like protein